jgi:5-oxoprolinase (ATP-hydrolysing)
MRVPVLAIHTIAAGGGSILAFDGASYRVGPESAGSNPGPACYRRGGPLTVTDANVMLGKIQPQYFPAVFGSEANQSLDQAVVLTKFTKLTSTINTATANNFAPEQVAAGFMAIAVANMANAIKKISLQRGYDVTHYVLCCFGGAGAQVACLVADNLGISKILIHPYAGVLSAYGIGLADMRTTKVESVELTLKPETIPQLESLFISLSNPDITPDKNIIKQVIRKVNLKYMGTNTTLNINFHQDLAIMEQEFATEHQTRYGFIQPDKALVVESAAVELVQPMDIPQEAIIERTRPLTESPTAIASVPMFAADSWHNAQVYRREDLQPQDCILGPAIIVEPISTIVIEPNWQATVSDRNCLILETI